MGMCPRNRKINLSEVKRVLVVRLDEIGDVVMTTPFLRELRRNLPEAWITLVVKPEVYNFVELCPYINEILTYHHWQTGKLWRRLAYLRMAYRDLWKRRFDLAILPRWGGGYYHGTSIAYLSGATWRVGYSENVSLYKTSQNNGFDRLLTHILTNSTLKHEVEHNLDVIHFLGGTVQDNRLELWVGQEDEAFAEQILKFHGVRPSDLLIAFGLGAGDPKRVWPLSNFVELGAWLKDGYHPRILVVGEEREKSLGDELQQQLGDMVINTVGQTTLRQACTLLKHCHLYIGNDAGPMHLAVAAGVPVIEISCHPLSGLPLHSNSPKRFGPWGVPHRVLQPDKAFDPCSDACTAVQAHCILSVSVEKVKEAVVALLSRQSEPIVQGRTWQSAGRCS